MDFRNRLDAGFLIGAAIVFSSAVCLLAIRRYTRGRRRQRPAYPTAPHTSKMWVNQPVSAPATKAFTMNDQIVAVHTDGPGVEPPLPQSASAS